MWRYKVAFKDKESSDKAIERLSNLCAKVYDDKSLIILESHDPQWNEVMTILDSIKGYSVIREYYD